MRLAKRWCIAFSPRSSERTSTNVPLPSGPAQKARQSTSRVGPPTKEHHVLALLDAPVNWARTVHATQAHVVTQPLASCFELAQVSNALFGAPGLERVRADLVQVRLGALRVADPSHLLPVGKLKPSADAREHSVVCQAACFPLVQGGVE